MSGKADHSAAKEEKFKHRQRRQIAEGENKPRPPGAL